MFGKKYKKLEEEVRELKNSLHYMEIELLDIKIESFVNSIDPNNLPFDRQWFVPHSIHNSKKSNDVLDRLNTKYSKPPIIYFSLHSHGYCESILYTPLKCEECPDGVLGKKSGKK